MSSAECRGYTCLGCSKSTQPLPAELGSDPMNFGKRPRICSYDCKEEEEHKEEEEEDGGFDKERKDWSSLTEPLPIAVLRRLDSLEDFFAFRSVCSGWRAAAAPSPDVLAAQPPLIFLTRFPAYTEAFCYLTRRRLYRTQLPWHVHSRRSLSYARGHLVTSTDPPNAKLLLWNIFSQARIRLPTAPEPFRRFLLSSHPAGSSLVLLFSKRSAVLQYCLIGDALWTICESAVLRIVDDMIFFGDEKLYALTDTMELLVDLAAGLEFSLLGGGGAVRTHQERWHAESGGELLVVCQRFVPGFDVFRWDSASCGWVELLDLGGKAIFPGSKGFAGSIAATGLGIRANCIYYVSYRKYAWYVFLKDQFVEVFSPDSPGLIPGQSTLQTVWVLRLTSQNFGPET